MSRRLYSLLLYLLLPVAVPWFLWKGWRTPAHRGSLRQRLGLGLKPRQDGPLWLHAASIGELRALSALLPQLESLQAPLLVTVGTPAGYARACEKFATDPRITVQAAPWDLPGAVRRFLAASQPRAAVFVETELWPNLIRSAAARGVPLTLVSARLSERSVQRYLRFIPGLMRDTVRAFTAIGAQSEADAARFLRLGAPNTALSVTGNLKFDLLGDAGQAGRGAALRARWAGMRWLWVAGSTHAGEEPTLLAAHRDLESHARTRGQLPPLLVLAPRRPERFGAVREWLAQQRVTAARSSEVTPDPAGVSVVLVDEMGVLPDWYAAGNAAFVGGSLVPVGGHNLLEPAALGLPVLTGAQVFNAPEVARSLIDAQGAYVVAESGDLARRLIAWFDSAAEASAAGARAAATVAAHRGAASRAAELVRASAWSAARSSSSSTARSASG